MYTWNDETLDCKKPESLASMVKRLGNPGSATLLHSNCTVFQIPHVDGAVGYHQIGSCAVVMGDPICLPPDIPELTKAFHLYCQKCSMKTVYLLTSQNFADWAINNACRTLIQVGSEFSINPTLFQIKRKLRWMVNQSLHHGVQVKEYKDFDPSLEYHIKNTIQTWSKQRHGPQIHLGNLNFFDSADEKRIFYAEQNRQIIGVLILTPLDLFQGWVVNSYLALLGAPVGTTEHLMCSAFSSLATENCHFLCLGVISGTRLGEVVGLNFFGKFFAHLIFKMTRWLFNLDAKANYLHKYRPNLHSTFLLCRDKITISELFAIKHVLNVKL